MSHAAAALGDTTPEWAPAGAIRTRRTAVASAAVVALVAWLPLQTPVAILLYQYAGISADAARLVLLAKDVAVAAMVVVMLPLAWPRLRLGRIDFLAAGYAAVVLAYAVIPRLAGDQLAIAAVIASLRELLVPVELYAVGRLAVAIGVPPLPVARAVLWTGVLAAIAALVVLRVAPPGFLASGLDLVTFVREVQGVQHATDLHAISIAVHYGGDTVYERAVMPFTHPVGTGHYLVLPLALLAARLAVRADPARVLRWVLVAAAVVVAAATIGTISRGAWGAAVVAVAAVGWRARRLAVAVAAIAVAAAFVALVPPFNSSITSIASGVDPSTQGHGEAIVEGVALLLQNPLGVGVGWSDFFGQVYGAGDVAGGETLYLNLAIAAGPLCLAFFVAWLAAIVLRAGSVADWVRRRPVDDWIVLGVVAATIGFAGSAVTSSPLLRFTTAGSFWIMVGVIATRPTRDVAPAQEGPQPAATLRSSATASS